MNVIGTLGCSAVSLTIDRTARDKYLQRSVKRIHDLDTCDYLAVAQVFCEQ